MAKNVNYELYDDRVLVKPAPAEEKTAGGIIIPDTAKEKPQRGTIVAVGPGKYAEQTGTLIPLKQQVGDVVLYGKYAGTEVSVDGDDYLIMFPVPCAINSRFTGVILLCLSNLSIASTHSRLSKVANNPIIIPVFQMAADENILDTSAIFKSLKILDGILTD